MIAELAWPELRQSVRLDFDEHDGCWAELRGNMRWNVATDYAEAILAMAALRWMVQLSHDRSDEPMRQRAAKAVISLVGEYKPEIILDAANRVRELKVKP